MEAVVQQGATMNGVGTPRIRRAAVAGLFYASDRRTLSADVHRLLDDVPEANDGAALKALIAPHAGYAYSGPVAAHAYARLRGARTSAIRRVVLIGPAHRVYVRGIALPDSDRFETPLGSVALDSEAIDEVARMSCAAFDDVAHRAEHALEVQLPFLQAVLGDFTLVPMAVGAASGDEVAAALERVFGGVETLIVVSSDLSHYHSYRNAQAIDARTVEAILTGARDIDHDEACGATPINGLIRCARAHRLEARLLDCRNSGDTAGDRSRVVGYAAFAFEPRNERDGLNA